MLTKTINTISLSYCVMDIVNVLMQNKYIHSLLILIFFYIISKLIVFISQKYILRLTAKTKTKVDDLIIEKTNKPISFILLLIGFRLALIPLEIKEKTSVIINDILSTLIIIIITYIIIAVFDILIEVWGKSFAVKTKSKIDDQLIRLIHRFSRIVFILLGLVFILQAWGIKIGPLLASLGIAGIAIAFALQNTLGNIFGGISLIIDKTIEVGDIVKLDSGESGKVYDVGIRSTKIKTWNNEIIIIPNGKLANSKIQNISQPDPAIRINIEFGVEYGSDPERVKKVVLDTVKKIKNVEKEPEPNIWFTEMGDFALKFKLMFWVDNLSKKWPTHQEAMTKIYNALKKARIRIPFPTRTIYMKKG